MAKCEWLKGLLPGLALSLVAGGLLADTLVVYSGAGLRPAVQPLLQQFEQQTGSRVLVEYAGMGQLITRFEQTRRGDVIISGTHFYTDRLIADGQVNAAWPLAFHGAVIGVYPGSAGKVQRFEDLARPGVRLALGDAESMALGRTAETILDASGLGDAIRANVVVRGTTVQQLALYAAQGNVDAAIIGVTTAVQQGDKLQVVQIPSHLYDPERVTTGVLNTSQNPVLAQRLVDFLRSEAGLQFFATAGFPLLPEGWQPPAVTGQHRPAQGHEHPAHPQPAHSHQHHAH